MGLRWKKQQPRSDGYTPIARGHADKIPSAMSPAVQNPNPNTTAQSLDPTAHKKALIWMSIWLSCEYFDVYNVLLLARQKQAAEDEKICNV